MSFQKPENALKRAEELIEVGKKQDALDTLNAALSHRKFRSMWTITIEQIMIKHLELCVELRKMRTAREGLYQYRTMCQAANIGSLEVVVQRLRKAAEDKVSEAKAAQDLQLSKMEDLDEVESPETILLRSIQAHDTRQQSQDRDVHEHFRFLWDTYKVVLEVLKSNRRLEEVYHETARCAFEFCRANQRPAEFKRLCDTLRRNYQDLHKAGSKVPAHQADPNAPETIARTLETRCKQLQISTELDLWRNAYETATEIHDLMTKVRPKPHLRSMYYEYLGKIFWKSENHVYHAFSCLKNLMFVKAAKQNITKEELQLLASKAVLATLCVPFQKASEGNSATLELTTEGETSPYEKAKKLALLFNAQTVPTRDSISQNLVEKTLLPFAAEPCKKLFALVESDFTPLSLCQDAKPFLDEIANGDLFNGQLVQYITPLKKIIFFRLMKQLSDVYANMTIDNFEKAASIVEFSTAEKWMANAARQQGIAIQINYSDQAIVFGAPRKLDMKSMRQPLIEIGYKLQQAMQRVAPEEQLNKEKVERRQLAEGIIKRVDEETKIIRGRQEEIERRKEEKEKHKAIFEREQAAKQRKLEEEEDRKERLRREEERVRREREREQQKKRDQTLQKNKEMLEEMKKQADFSKKELKIEGKKIKDIEAEDMLKIDAVKIMQAREEQKKRERMEKIRQRKVECKRVDHLARATREEERVYLNDWAEDIVAEDEKYLEAAEYKEAEKLRERHAADLEERDALIEYKVAKDDWTDLEVEDRMSEFARAKKAREERLKRLVMMNKIKRAKQRRQDWEDEEASKRSEEERLKVEERRRQEEEERLRQEAIEEEERKEAEARREEERKREEEERRKRDEERRAERERLRKEEDEARDRAEQRRREREEEIEARQKDDAPSRPAARDDRAGAWGRRDSGRDDRDRDERPPAQGGAWRSSRDRDEPRRDEPRRDEPRRDERRDEPRRSTDEDNWRRGPASSPKDSTWGRSDNRPPARADDRRDRPNPFGSARPADDRRPARDDDRRPARDDDRRPARDDDDKGGSWRKPAPAGRESESGAGPWRRDGPPRDSPASRDAPSAPWRRPDTGARDAPARDAPAPRASAWGRPPAADTPAREPARREEPRREEPRREERPVRREEPAAEPRKEAPAAEPAAEEDDGFATVVKKKKGGKASDDVAKVAPWKRN